MKKNLKNLMALVLAGAMLTAGTAVFAADAEWNGETGGPNQSGTLAGTGQTVDTGSSPIRVVVPTQGVDFVVDPDGLLSGADLGDLTVDQAGTVMFLRTEDGEKILSNKSGNIEFINKSTIPINLEIEASVDTAYAAVDADRAKSNIVVTTSDKFSDDTKTAEVEGEQKKVGSDLQWKKLADDTEGKAGDFMQSDGTTAHTDATIKDDPDYAPVWDTEPAPEHITPQIELVVGIEDNGEVAVKAPTLKADLTIDEKNEVKKYAMIPDASDLISLEYVGDDNDPYKFSYNDEDVDDEEWPRVNVYVKGDANSSSDWSQAKTDNFKLNIKYTLSKAGTHATFNTAKDTKVVKMSNMNGFEKTTSTLRFRALSGSKAGTEVEFPAEDLKGFITPAASGLSLTPEAMGVLKTQLGNGTEEVKIAISGEGTYGKMITIK